MSEVTYLSNGDTQCNNCGNVWDGHAQCGCWQWMYSAFDEFEELDESSDDEGDGDDDEGDEGDGDGDDDVSDGGHTDSEDSELDSDLGSVIDTDVELLNIAINLNTIFDDIEV